MDIIQLAPNLYKDRPQVLGAWCRTSSRLYPEPGLASYPSTLTFTKWCCLHAEVISALIQPEVNQKWPLLVVSLAVLHKLSKR